MGCISSREAKRFPYMPVIHGSKRRGDSSHDVSLTFSTLNSLRLDPNQYSFDQEMVKIDGPDPPEQELEKINVRELMEGLDEPLHASLTDPNFSFWMQKDQLDPQVIANFRKTMIELSPQHPNLRPLLSPVKYHPDQIPKFPGIVKARVAAFEEKIDARRRRSFRSIPSLKISSLQKPLSGAKGKLVLFSTSLRGVRKTYEDCCNVKSIIQSYGVWIDERDVSMHGGFRDELSEILGAGSKLPKIFADGRYLGGIEEVERMHEDGELREALKDCEMEKGLKGINGVACEVCGDYKFFPCEICSGSCKVFLEDEEDEIGGFRRCGNCNENGLVRCNLCS